MKKLIGGLLSKVNNIRIRNKLLILYICCVVIPILLINCIFYLRVSENEMNKEMDNLNLSMDRIRLSLSTNIEQCIQVCNIINIDKVLNESLDKVYPNTAEYVDEYKAYLDNEVGKFIIGYSHISNITIYTTNDSIISGGNYALLTDDMKNSDIYKAVFSQPAAQPVLQVSGAASGKKAVSMVSRCSYYISPYRKMIKIDLNDDMLFRIAASESVNGNVYLFDKNNDLVFQYLKDPSLNISSPEAIRASGRSGSNIVVTKVFGSGGVMDGWRLVGVFSNTGLNSSLRASGWSIFLLAATMFVVATLVLLVISRSIVRRLNVVSAYLKSPRAAEHLVLDIEPGRDEIGNLIVELNKGAERTNHLINVVYMGEVEKARAELFALQSQIHPHFLFNTLNTIRLKCMLKGETETAGVVKRLALLFRRLVGWEEEFITVEEEIAFIVDFLEIQKFRYEDKLSYHIHMEKEAMNHRIPKMLLQPLVENASFHGIEMSESNGEIGVIIRIRNNMLYCIVKDNGIGIPAEKLANINRIVSGEENGNPEESIGIYNVYKRLKFYFGSRARMRVASRPGRGTAVVLKILLDGEDTGE